MNLIITLDKKKNQFLFSKPFLSDKKHTDEYQNEKLLFIIDMNLIIFVFYLFEF
jgi:hypothetical protein